MPDIVWNAEKSVLYCLVCVIDETFHLIPIAHEVMYRYQALVHDHPIGVEGPLYQEVCQGRDRDIGLVCTLKQIWNQDDVVTLLINLAPLGTHNLDVSSWVQWSPRWLLCTPPWPGPDLPDCVVLPGSCHWESVLLLSASWPGLGDNLVPWLIWNWTLMACWWYKEGSSNSRVRCNILCCVCQLCHGTAAWSLLLLLSLVSSASSGQSQSQAGSRESHQQLLYCTVHPSGCCSS